MPSRYRIPIRLFDRRTMLKATGAVLAGTAAGLGCDSLDIPPPLDPGPLPGISPQADFYLQSCCGTPDVDPETFTMDVEDADGAVLATIDQQYVLGLTGQQKEHTLQCIGSNPRFLFVDNAMWTGLPFRDLLDDLGVTVPADAVELVFWCVDGYDVSIPITDLDTPIWLVWEMNEEPLTRPHGAPFRFLVPGRYGTKNPKWCERLVFATEPHTGFWEREGWSNEAAYRPNALTLSPAAYAVVGEGTIRIQGSAFAGLDPVTRVEWTEDDGATWQDATITYTSENEHTWRLWSVDFTPPEPGTYKIRTRVTTESGAMSADTPDGTNRFLGFDGGMEITLEVT